MTRDAALLQVAAADYRLYRATLQECVDALEAARSVDKVNRKCEGFWRIGSGAKALTNARAVLRGMDGRSE